MKNGTNQLYMIFNIIFLCSCLAHLTRANDNSLKSHGLLVCKNSSVICNEKVAGNVWVEGPVSYQTCLGKFFPLTSEDKDVKSVRGSVCFSTGGVNVPQSFSNFFLEPFFSGTLMVVPLFIQSLKAKVFGGCGFAYSPIILLAKAIANRAGEFLVPVEISTRIEFCEPFCKIPSVEISYNIQSNELLLPCAIQSLNFEDPDDGPIFASAVWVSAEAYAADVTRSGFTLTLILYISVGVEALSLLPAPIVELNRFINQIINKSGVSFLAEGKVSQSKKCC